MLGENKAAPARCPHCRRPVGDEVEHCRPTRAGHWYCWQNGLIYDPSKFVTSAPRPIGSAEQEAIDRWASPIADAEKVVDERLVSFTAAELAYTHASQAVTAVGASETLTYAGALRVSLREREDDRTAAARYKAQSKLAAASLTRGKALNRLTAARVELQRLQMRQERDQLAGRHHDDLAAGRIKREPEL